LTLNYQELDSRTTAVQTPELRIAPWIMVSDLDPNAQAWVAGYSPDGQPPGPNALQRALVQRVMGFDVARVRPFGSIELPTPSGITKPFLRDVMKAGYSTAPHYSGVVVQRNLDDVRAHLGLGLVAATFMTGGTIIKPPGGESTAQDNGGKLLVSSPSEAYPYGRIFFGGAPQMPCRVEPFYRGQKLQALIRLDSS
jgi:hypothetical protein